MQTKVFNRTINYQIHHPQWIKEGRPLIIFLHEGLGSIGQWKGFPEFLSNAAQLPALIYDRFGYGQSADWESPISPDFLEKEALIYLPELLKVLDYNNEYYLFGHSDGGTIALRHAAENPSKLLGIIVEAPHVFLEDQSLQGIRMARTMLRKPGLLDRMNKYQNGRAAQLIDQWTQLWLRPDLREWQMIDLLPQIDVPMLLIQGEHDDFGTFEQIDITAKLANTENVEVKKLADCAHIPHLQQHEIVLNASARFLQNYN